MPFVPLTDQDRRDMLTRIGINHCDLLFDDIPAAARLGTSLELPEALSEIEVERLLNGIAGINRQERCFAGAGAYWHHVPACVDALSSRGEFFTAYTPYQAEVSQGTLTAIFEYQTMMSRLTGMDVANASLYDGATALAESVLMSARITRRRKILVSRGVHPHYREVLSTYAWAAALELVDVPLASGVTDLDAAQALLDKNTSAIVLQRPNFLGCIESLEPFAQAAADVDAHLITCVTESLSMGLLKTPGSAGAHIVCGEAHSFGNPPAFGGPHLGFLAARKDFIRSMPGRLVGRSRDRAGRDAFILTLQTREQHIRRERATSNICTNQGLCALRAAMYLSLLGPRLRDLAVLNHRIAASLRHRLNGSGFSPCFDAPYFNEFVMRREDVPALTARLSGSGIVAGVPIGRWYPEYPDALLLCATELTTTDDINALCRAVDIP